jgi:hypothetical protein
MIVQYSSNCSLSGTIAVVSSDIVLCIDTCIYICVYNNIYIVFDMMHMYNT